MSKREPETIFVAISFRLNYSSNNSINYRAFGLVALRQQLVNESRAIIAALGPTTGLSKIFAKLKNGRTAVTHFEHNHYFVELLQDLAPGLSSGAMVLARQERARDFVAELRRWLETESLSNDVSDLKVTALGRVMMTCNPSVADWLADLDHPDVVSISLSSTRGQGGQLAASLPRIA